MSNPLFLVNGRFLSQRMTGVQRFAYKVCEAMHANGVAFAVVAPKRIDPGYDFRFPVIRWGITKGPLWEMTDLHAYLRLHGSPLLFSFSGLGPVGYSPQVMTIHDLAFLENPEWYSKSYVGYYAFFTRRLAAAALKILTVSETSKKAIISRLPVDGTKIEVVYNAADFTGLTPRRPSGIGEEPFILSVGSLDPRKNQERVVRAFALSGLQDTCRLVLVGKSDSVFNMNASEGIRASLLGYVSDEELLWLYRNTSLFVYPSLQEGFGIPPLEAMSQGCPVVLSDIPVFRELFADTALLADPLDERSIAEAMRAMLNDEHRRKECIRMGYSKAESFSWQRTAGQIANLAREILNS